MTMWQIGGIHLYFLREKKQGLTCRLDTSLSLTATNDRRQTLLELL
jgi:hypothetical protein